MANGMRTSGQDGPAPRPAPRTGPRPLALHLMTQASTLASSRAALAHLRNGSLAWKPPLAEAGRHLAESLAAAGPEAWTRLDEAVAAEAMRRHDLFLAGIEAYRRHPYRRDLPPVPEVWRDGTTRLLDYRLPESAGGRPVLVVPSLINRAYILDLTLRRSLVRYLAQKGLAPFLVDWDAPGEAERRFTLADYIAGRLEAMLDHVTRLTGRKAAVVGYCMGGLLALALAQRRPDAVSGLVLVATPFDFVTGREASAVLMKALAGPMGEMVDRVGEVPVDMLQAMFAGLDPGLAARKFMAFARLAPAGARARDFVALEDWANDGVPLAAPVARECLFGWYGENDPVQGRWCIEGRPVNPAEVKVPTLVMIPVRDRIVPPASALPLWERIPSAKLMRLSGGHVGMLTGPRAKTDVYGPLARWLRRAGMSETVA